MKNVPATTGTNYYGLIADFDSFDVIQLAGSVNKYILAASSSDLPQGTGIFLNDGATPKLIGIVANISPSDLSLTNSNQFTFV